MDTLLEKGERGSKAIPGRTLTGTYYIIDAIEESTITVTTNWKGSDPVETLTLAQGQKIYGVFKDITPTSGYIVAYN